jgi:long-chain acyl-CoA synthetase
MTGADRPWYASWPGTLRVRPQDDPVDLLSAFHRTVGRHPGRPAVHHFDATTTWAELDERSDALAAALGGLGVGRGDRVAVYLQNQPQYLLTVLATWKCGGIVVPVNPMNRERELTLQLADSGAVVLVSGRAGHAVAAPVVAAQPQVRAVVTVGEHDGQTRDDQRVLPGPRLPLPEGTLDLAALLGKYAGRCAPGTAPGPDDPAFLTYTSGTTGPPKAAVNTHRQVMWATGLWRDVTGTREDDVLLGMPPLFHITGLVGVMTLSLLTGAAVVLTHRFEPSVVLEALRERRATVVTGAITAFGALSNAPGARPEDFASLRAVTTGGAPVAPGAAARFEQLTGRHLHPGYGLTETASASHMTPLGLPSPVDPGTGALSVGVPLPGIDAVVLDDDGAELPAGEAGEIAMSGPSVVEGYWRRPEESAAAFVDGRLRTGDIGFVDADGWFYVVDRKKDQINAGGYKVWPREVEDVLYEHPAVREAAVVGAPDDYLGETVLAYVSLQPGTEAGPEELIGFARQRLAAYKCPRRVEVLADLPKTVSGKILRRELRMR